MKRGVGLTKNDQPMESEGHVRNWLECVRSRQRRTSNAAIEVGYAHSVASIMRFKSRKSGRHMVFDAARQEIRPA